MNPHSDPMPEPVTWQVLGKALVVAAIVGGLYYALLVIVLSAFGE